MIQTCHLHKHVHCCNKHANILNLMNSVYFHCQFMFCNSIFDYTEYNTRLLAFPLENKMSRVIPSWQIVTSHAQTFRGARDLAFCLKVPLDSLFVWASSGGSGETARMRRLAWTFAARIGDKYQIRFTRPECWTTKGRFPILSLPWLKHSLCANSECLQLNEPRHEKPCFFICELQRRISTCASALSDQHLCCSLPR